MTPSDTGVTARSTATRRDMLRHFLQSRRARLSPRDPRLVTVGRRGTPGLRREEVALLAGVSVSWYTWLEQGRDIKVSGRVLDAVSSALRLNAAERAHLYRLTGVHPPPAVPRSTAHGATRIVDGWPDHPAYITDRHWNNVAANRLAHTTLQIPPAGHNHLSEFFTDPGSRERYPQWSEMARRLVGQFRAAAARHPDDRTFDRMVHEIALISPEFRQ
ncbi:helix-turn-helix transcriptional regulator, partial [Streptomyces decoyicus]|uniref:helix-turn-helix transcriptional regulator n=1 Tax=Streptomyces decoyicus TaxID=249567 RepID=UPI0033A4CAEE